MNNIKQIFISAVMAAVLPMGFVIDDARAQTTTFIPNVVLPQLDRICEVKKQHLSLAINALMRCVGQNNFNPDGLPFDLLIQVPEKRKLMDQKCPNQLKAYYDALLEKAKYCAVDL